MQEAKETAQRCKQLAFLANADVVYALLLRGADAQAKGGKYGTAAHDRSHFDVIKYLRDFYVPEDSPNDSFYNTNEPSEESPAELSVQSTKPPHPSSRHGNTSAPSRGTRLSVEEDNAYANHREPERHESQNRTLNQAYGDIAENGSVDTLHCATQLSSQDPIPHHNSPSLLEVWQDLRSVPSQSKFQLLHPRNFSYPSIRTPEGPPSSDGFDDRSPPGSSGIRPPDTMNSNQQSENQNESLHYHPVPDAEARGPKEAKLKQLLSIPHCDYDELEKVP